MASLGWNSIDEDSATEALILQLIAQDFGIDSNELNNTPDGVWDSTADPETELSASPSSSGMLHEVPHSGNDRVRSLDGTEQPEHVTTPKITSAQEHSTSTASLYPEQHSTTIQAIDPIGIKSNEMSKRSAETAGLSSLRLDAPFQDSSPPSNDRLHTDDNDDGSSHGPEHQTAVGSEDATQTMSGTQNKRAKTASSSQSFSKKEQPKHSNIAGSSQPAIIQNHGAESTQQHQPIITRNSYATEMQVDEGPTQSIPGAMASARSATLGDWGDVRAELEGLPKVPERDTKGHADTASSHEPSQKASVIPHRTKSEHPGQAAKTSRPLDPFNSNHKDHLEPKTTPRAKKVVGGLDSNLDPVLDSDGINNEAQHSEDNNISEFISPYDDDWHTSTAQAQTAKLAFINESTIQHEGQTLTYIEIPWTGKPGWIESSVDGTALEYLNDAIGYGGGFGGRHHGLTMAQLMENQRKRQEEEPVDVLVGDDETCDSIIEEILKREERERKGKGKVKGEAV